MTLALNYITLKCHHVFRFVNTPHGGKSKRFNIENIWKKEGKGPLVF